MSSHPSLWCYVMRYIVKYIHSKITRVLPTNWSIVLECISTYVEISGYTICVEYVHVFLRNTHASFVFPLNKFMSMSAIKTFKYLYVNHMITMVILIVMKSHYTPNNILYCSKMSYIFVLFPACVKSVTAGGTIKIIVHNRCILSINQADSQ